MYQPVSRALEILAAALRPYVAARMQDSGLAGLDFHPDEADIQLLLVFMWDHWHELFRHQLTFLDRSAISELREYRNRWAHQTKLGDRDLFRVIDNVERLMLAINAEIPPELRLLYRESLNRLHQAEQPPTRRTDRLRLAWQLGVCSFCCLLVEVAVFAVIESPLSWIIGSAMLLAFLRVGWLFFTRGRQPAAAGPRECRECGRIIYSHECPYCKSDHEVSMDLRLTGARAT
ncbi:MAG: hypothetical protein KDA85_10315 [Planctomycetaceae bacterium]|nr:hypothetical protein [Planctomycetaceae bacterium]